MQEVVLLLSLYIHIVITEHVHVFTRRGDEKRTKVTITQRHRFPSAVSNTFEAKQSKGGGRRMNYRGRAHSSMHHTIRKFHLDVILFIIFPFLFNEINFVLTPRVFSKWLRRRRQTEKNSKAQLKLSRAGWADSPEQTATHSQPHTAMADNDIPADCIDRTPVLLTGITGKVFFK